MNTDPGRSVVIPLNSALFEWVIENVFKNAIDSMEGSGELNIRLTESEKNAIIDITDTGKGIPKTAFKKIFNPGFHNQAKRLGTGSFTGQTNN